MLAIIKDKIRKQGGISIKDFIEIALFHPQYGYYINYDPIGKDADFTTSPEISQIFGEIIAFFLIDFWQRKYPKQQVNLVEMGAGHGTLMSDILRTARNFPDFYQNININIIEINQKLKKIQQDKLQDFDIKFWSNFDEFAQNSTKIPLFFLSNELFDCFAIDQFIFQDALWYQKIVTLKENNLKFDKIQAKIDINSLIPQEFKKNIKNGTIFEQNIAAENFMAKLSKYIAKNAGIAINIDYGYYENQFYDTLQSVKKHKFNNILYNIGKSDITSHVNFYKLAEISLKNGLNVNFMTQREFLLSNGLELRKKILLQSAKSNKQILTSAIDRLIDNNQMGNLFKVIVANL